MTLDIQDIRKSFGRFPALQGVSLSAAEGEFLALLGPSGSGKTTLLRVIAGLEFPDAGHVRFKGDDLLAQRVRDRRIGFVFQHYALFKHMTAAQNVAFGLEAMPADRRPAKARIAAQVEELLALVQLEGLGGRFPSQLSGGQRQRVALARALAIEPRLLLLDEPFGALDAKVRRELRRWLKSLHTRTGLTTIFVTHDQEEALDLADRVVVMRAGGIEQVGTPEQLYHEPQNAFVFEFLGEDAPVPCEIRGGRAFVGGAEAPLSGPTPADGAATAHVRPNEYQVEPAGLAGLQATVRDVMAAGPDIRLDLALAIGGAVEVRLPRAEASAMAIGQGVTLRPRRVRVWA